MLEKMTDLDIVKILDQEYQKLNQAQFNLMVIREEIKRRDLKKDNKNTNNPLSE